MDPTADQEARMLPYLTRMVWNGAVLIAGLLLLRCAHIFWPRDGAPRAWLLLVLATGILCTTLAVVLWWNLHQDLLRLPAR
jgi:hypothetical protein